MMPIARWSGAYWNVEEQPESDRSCVPGTLDRADRTGDLVEYRADWKADPATEVKIGKSMAKQRRGGR